MCTRLADQFPSVAAVQAAERNKVATAKLKVFMAAKAKTAAAPPLPIELLNLGVNLAAMKTFRRKDVPEIFPTDVLGPDQPYPLDEAVRDELCKKLRAANHTNNWPGDDLALRILEYVEPVPGAADTLYAEFDRQLNGFVPCYRRPCRASIRGYKGSVAQKCVIPFVVAAGFCCSMSNQVQQPDGHHEGGAEGHLDVHEPPRPGLPGRGSRDALRELGPLTKSAGPHGSTGEVRGGAGARPRLYVLLDL